MDVGKLCVLLQVSAFFKLQHPVLGEASACFQVGDVGSSCLGQFHPSIGPSLCHILGR